MPSHQDPDQAFSVAAGRRGGLSERQLRSTRFARPFAGVREARPEPGAVALARAYAAKLAPAEFFSHSTAALLHDMWLPWHLEHEEVVHVSVRRPARAPRDRRVRGHHLIDRPELVGIAHGLPVANAVETWCQLATQLGLDDLVVAAESLLAKGRLHRLVLDDLLAVVHRSEHPRQKLLEAALDEVRAGSRSSGETRLRLLLVRAGLPEPRINTAVFGAAGQWLAECDLVYPAAKVVIEYEGEYHFLDQRQLRKDVTRYERLQDEGWRVVRVSKDDLRERPHEVVDRVRRAISR